MIAVVKHRIVGSRSPLKPSGGVVGLVPEEFLALCCHVFWCFVLLWTSGGEKLNSVTHIAILSKSDTLGLSSPVPPRLHACHMLLVFWGVYRFSFL